MDRTKDPALDLEVIGREQLFDEAELAAVAFLARFPEVTGRGAPQGSQSPVS